MFRLNFNDSAESSIIHFSDLLKLIEETINKCFMIIKLEIHLRCFAYLLKKPKDTKIYQENALQQISSTSFPQFFREIFTFYEIMKQSLNERKVKYLIDQTINNIINKD